MEVFFSEPVDVKIATLGAVTDAKDPDELLKREGGRELFDRMIVLATDPLELLFARVRTQMGGGGISARARIVEDFIARLVDLGLERVDKIRYQLILKRLSQITEVDWETIAGLIAQRRARVRPTGSFVGAPAPIEAKPFGPREVLLGCILNDPALPLSLREDDWTLIEPETFEDADVREVAGAISRLIVDEHSPSLAAVLAAAEEPGVQRAATRLSAEVERMTDAKAEKLAHLWNGHLKDARAARARLITSGDCGAAGPPEALSKERIETMRANFKRVGIDPRAIPSRG